jgi:hypothetical protein
MAIHRKEGYTRTTNTTSAATNSENKTPNSLPRVSVLALCIFIQKPCHCCSSDTANATALAELKCRAASSKLHSRGGSCENSGGSGVVKSGDNSGGGSDKGGGGGHISKFTPPLRHTIVGARLSHQFTHRAPTNTAHHTHKAHNPNAH